MTDQLAVCVFCGARPGANPAVVSAAVEVGRLVGHRGHRLIYGGGGSGLMGTVSWAAHRAGADITGIIPGFLYERERSIAAPPQRLTLTTTMSDRKQHMLDEADAFLALAGGYGTLDEVLAVLSLQYLGLLDKPLVLLDVDGCWESFDRMLSDIYGRGYAVGAHPLYAVCSSPAEAMDVIEALTGRAARPQLELAGGHHEHH